MIVGMVLVGCKSLHFTANCDSSLSKNPFVFELNEINFVIPAARSGKLYISDLQTAVSKTADF